MSHHDRRTSVVVLVVGLAAFVVVAALLVPWDPVPGELEPPPAESVFSAEQIARAEAFSRWARVWSWSSLAVSLLALGVLGFSSLGPRLVRRLPGPWWVQVPLAVTVVGIAVRLVTLPLGVMAHRHVVDYGLSTQSLAGYLGDVVRGEAIGTGVTAIAVLLVFGCARRWRRVWPAVAGGALGTLVLVGSWVYPIAIEPVFNDFEPLPAGSLRASILDLADRQGVDVDEVLVADASRRTTTLNAYVSGLGSTRRVVVYDNLVEDLPEDQALSVVAHEFAHAKHQDVLVGSALGVAGVFFGVGLLGVVVSAAGWTTAGRDGGARRGAARAGPGGARGVPGQSGAEHAQPSARDPRGSLRAARDGRRGVLRDDAEAAGGALAQRPDAAGLVAALVREPPDGARADRARGTRDKRVPDGQRRLRGAVAGGGVGVVRPDAVAGVVERALDDRTEGEDGDDDQRRDAGDQQAVLDGGGAFLGAGPVPDERAKRVRHECLLVSP